MGTMNSERRLAAGPIARLVRHLRPDHNPLRRRLDRVHTRVVACFVVAFLIGAPIAIAVTGPASYHTGLRTARQEALTHRQVDALVLAVERPMALFPTPLNTKIRWRTPTGATRTGHILRDPADRPGAHRRIWIDRAGKLVAAPRDRDKVVTQSVATTVAAVAMLTLVLIVGYMIAEHELQRRRLNLWEREWRTVAPHWTGRH